MKEWANYEREKQGRLILNKSPFTLYRPTFLKDMICPNNLYNLEICAPFSSSSARTRSRTFENVVTLHNISAIARKKYQARMKRVFRNKNK